MNLAFNKDIMHWKKFPEYDIIWCDPPWEQKMVNYFETMMQKNGQPKPNNTIYGILEQLAKLSNKKKPVFIEYSIKGRESVIDVMQKEGHRLHYCVDTIQQNGNTYCILVFNCPNFRPDGTERGFKIIEYTCNQLGFNTVFDPFAGIGKSAKVFIKKGKSYIGSEINTQRFNILKKILWEEQQ